MSGLYIHIPFCKQACSYCDFYFVTRRQQKQAFVDELINEIHHKKDTRFTESPVRTIYFGGGSPSLLTPRQVESILEAIYQTFQVEAEEITIEMNPDDVTAEYLNALKSAGINRASMGVQSFDDKLLKFMHRAHNSEEALSCLEILQESEFDVFTVDLIYGNPGQSLEALQKDLDTLLRFNPPHVSAYSLTIESRTRLGKQVELGRLVPPEDDLVARHFDLVVETLSSAGIEQYEVSNFARAGKEAVHNSNYWSHKNYLGLGPGAHSFWWEEEQKSARRWNNKEDLTAYLQGEWRSTNEPELLNLETLAEERLMLGLRTTNGISPKNMEAVYKFEFNESQFNYLQRLKEQGKATIDEQIRLTKEGLKIADTILLDILTL